MQITSLRIMIEGSDIIEQWVYDTAPKFDKKLSEILIPQNINSLMEEFYIKNVKNLEADSPLVAALSSAIDNFPPIYSQFGTMLEVRYHDALKGIVLEK